MKGVMKDFTPQFVWVRSDSTIRAWRSFTDKHLYVPRKITNLTHGQCWELGNALIRKKRRYGITSLLQEAASGNRAVLVRTRSLF